MQIAVAILLIIHGFAHLVGFVAAFSLGQAGRSAHKTSILGGRVDIGARGIRAVGLLWLALSARVL